MGKKPEKNQRFEMEIGGRTVLLRPLPLKKFKEAMKVVFSVMDAFAKSATIPPAEFMKQLPEMILGNFDALVPFIIDRGVNDFATPEWIEDNMTVPDMEAILAAAYVINGVDDFLARLRTGFHPSPESPQPAPSSSPGSSTSSASATAGPSETPRS